MPFSEIQSDFSYAPAVGQLDEIVSMMKEISRQTDPKAVFREYVSRVRNIYPVDQVLMLHRDAEGECQVRVARMTDWDFLMEPAEESNLYQPVCEGLLHDLCQRGEACIINRLEVDEEDPAWEFLEGMQSLRAVPLFDHGTALHMIVGLKTEPDGFREEELPVLVWLSNLFGQAIQNLMLAQKLKSAFQSVDRELKVVGEIQQSLLPEVLPQIPTLELAAYYQTSQRAGGDYYDFFPLPNGKWGIFIADVSGHGTPAAVVMAIMHTIAHTYMGTHEPPSEFLNHLNKHLAQRYTAKNGTFVTAFYGVYDPETRLMSYASAGHNPPQRRRCGTSVVTLLDKAGRMPLGISEEITYDNAEEQLQPGDRVVLYTDGIIEAYAPSGELFGMDRLGSIVGRCDLNTTTIVDSVVESLQTFTQATQISDDRTMVVMKVR